MAAKTAANKSSARMPQPFDSFSSLRIGQGLRTSNNLKNRKPSAVMMQIFFKEIPAVIKNAAGRKVSAWPANSSITTSRGSGLPVAVIMAGANRTQMTEPARIRAAIVIAIGPADTPKWLMAAKINTGGSEPHVPGANGSRPSPKHDVSILFIVAEG